METFYKINSSLVKLNDESLGIVLNKLEKIRLNMDHVVSIEEIETKLYENVEDKTPKNYKYRLVSTVLNQKFMVTL